MSRRNISKKHFPKPDLVYNSYLINLLINRILKSGKKTLRKRRSKVKSPKRYSLFGGFIRNGSVQQFVKGLLN